MGATREKFFLRSRTRFWLPLTLVVIAISNLLVGIAPELACGPGQAYAFCVPEEGVLRQWMDIVSSAGLAFFNGSGGVTALMLFLSSRLFPDNKRTGERATLTVVPFKARTPGAK